MTQKDFLQSLLDEADVRLGGDRPWDIQVHDPRLYARLLSGGSMALGESYMDGWWDAEQLDETFNRILRSKLQRKVRSIRTVPHVLHAALTNRSRKSRAFKIGEHHYDLGNDLYEAMLDKRMIYSCAYWKNAATLDEAQEAKLDLICRKARLAPGMRVLDIGCGWGGLAQFMAERYGVSAVGVTVSKEQAALARERVAGLPVEIRLQDYRDLDERFDAIVSVGMYEHVGHKNYRTYFDVARRCLSDDGLFVLHTIGGNESAVTGDPWIEKYIFPNSLIPSPAQTTRALEGRFVIEDWHNFGTYYDPTLMAWFANFDAAWPRLKDRYGERFYRMWKYYLLACAGGFRARHNNLWQLVLSRNGLAGGYESVR